MCLLAAVEALLAVFDINGHRIAEHEISERQREAANLQPAAKELQLRIPLLTTWHESYRESHTTNRLTSVAVMIVNE
jgi:hypothetical protein